MGLEANTPSAISYGVPDESPETLSDWGAVCGHALRGLPTGCSYATSSFSSSLLLPPPLWQTVKELVPGGPAETLGVKVGHRIAAVAGRDVRQLPYASTLSLLQSAPRPCTIQFRDIYSVSRGVAAYCQDPRNVLKKKKYLKSTAAPVGSAGSVPPSVPASVPAPAPAPAAAPDYSGWQTLHDPHGRPYYAHTSGRTSWTWPPT